LVSVRGNGNGRCIARLTTSSQLRQNVAQSSTTPENVLNKMLLNLHYVNKRGCWDRFGPSFDRFGPSFDRFGPSFVLVMGILFCFLAVREHPQDFTNRGKYWYKQRTARGAACRGPSSSLPNARHWADTTV
jgi:hypothetical protein